MCKRNDSQANAPTTAQIACAQEPICPNSPPIHHPPDALNCPLAATEPEPNRYDGDPVFDLFICSLARPEQEDGGHLKESSINAMSKFLPPKRLLNITKRTRIYQPN